MSFLEEVVVSTERATDKRKRRRSLLDVRSGLPTRDDARPFLRALLEPGISLIAEFKRSSPSKGALVPLGTRVEDYVAEYVKGGARALSILTEEQFFLGSVEDLEKARARTDLPLLRKDFVLDEYQVYEAAQVGADAVLLIAAVLEDGLLRELHELTRSLAMDALVEVRNRTELERALGFDADLIGVNNRDLKTRPSRPRSFEIDLGRTLKLLGEMPTGVTVVAESGLKERRELDELEATGQVDAALIGSALMQADDRVAKCRELTRASPASAQAERADRPALVS